MDWRKGLALLVLIIFAQGLAGCGDDNGDFGSGESYVEACAQHAMECTETDDEEIAITACEQSWNSLESQTGNPSGCESAFVEVYECRIARICPVDEQGDGSDDPCMNEHASAGLACHG